MKVGIVQQLVGHIGGNDKVLEALFDVFKDDEVHIFTFSASSNVHKLPDNKSKSTVTHTNTELSAGTEKPVIHSKFPVHIPLLGIYQKFLMPQHDYSDMDILISTTGYVIKTKKPLIMYDQNNLSNDFKNETPLKYSKGLWKLYFLPYKILNKPRVIKNAIYVSNSEYSAKLLFDASGIKAKVIHPSVDTDIFYELPKKEQICAIGRFSPEKNIEMTINILNRVKYPCFILGNVTTPNKRYFAKLEKMTKSHVHLMPNEPRSELLKLMAESKILFTSAKETFGITTIEGIASGCVPIAPDNSAHPETIPDKSLRYAENDKAEAIEIIDNIMKNGYNTDTLKEHIKMFRFEEFKRKFKALL